MSDTILIIGASGFLGKRLATAFPGHTVVGTFHNHPQAGLEFLDLSSLQDLRELLHRVSPSVVVYAAGLTDVDACEKEPVSAWRLNADAVKEIALWGRARVVYLSTDYVFDGTRGLYSEDDMAAPVNVYGRTKLAGERAILGHGQPNLVVRVSGLYDTRGVKGQDFSSPRVPLVSDDTRLSSPVHVEDVASAVRLLLDTGRHGIYHTAGPDALSRYEFWQLVALRFTSGTTVPPPNAGLAPRPRDSSLQTRRLEALGWRARRACEGLPPLAAKRPARITNHLAPDEEGHHIDALLIDCVGALLTCRAWLPQNDLLEEVDRSCAAATNGAEFWRKAAHDLGLGDADLPTLYDLVACRYAPNPPLWGRLPGWRARYRLALVNNGPAATFSRWVCKYGLDSVFDVLANSEEMGVRKPAREFFLAVANRLGTSPDRCLLLDDTPANIEGARRCGMRAIQTFELRSYPLSIHDLEGEAEIKTLLEGDRHG